MRKHLPALLLLACAALIGGTFYFLLKDRFNTGDVYPPSSSLRSDPLGAMMLYESLEQLPGVRIDRDVSPFDQLPPGQGTTYLHLAAQTYNWESISRELYRTIDQFLHEGGRLVVILDPEYTTNEELKKKEKEKELKKKKDAEKAAKVKTRDAKTNDKKKDAASDKPAGKSKKEEQEFERYFVSLKEKWGLEFDRARGRKDPHLATKAAALPLPSKLPWHGDSFLKSPDASWQIIYKDDRGPVIAEKKVGAGSIVIVMDSYLVSNEALVNDRHPELLAWLVGPADHIVFDEAHLGITDSPGLATLARKYGLHGGVAVLIILAGLFVWKCASTLVPRSEAKEKAAGTLAGRAAGAGFVSLLRRNIPGDRVFDVCLQEWRKSFAHGNRATPREKDAVEAIAREEQARPPRERNPVAAYRKIRAALHRHTTKPTA